MPPGLSASFELALASLRAGRLVILADGRGRADLVAAAHTVDDAAVNFMATHGRGLIAIAMSAARVDRLRLQPMAAGWSAPDRPFTISVEASAGISTGISAGERAHTIRTAAATHARPADLTSPGHIFPLRAVAGGLGQRRGRVEAAVALIERAGLGDAAALCEILDDDGELAALDTVRRLAFDHALAAISIDELAAAPHPVQEVAWPSS
jgi:3,4-dihydroxy 2-butanone 4-phosphate synthase / GTP cyclohydrolase II